MGTAVKAQARTKFTPPELAARWGIDPAKILAWIKSGEIRAIDACTVQGGRPRYLIDQHDVFVFEEAREVIPACPPPRARRARRSTVKQYV